MIKYYLILLFSSLGFGAFRQVETVQEFVYDFSVSGGASNTLIDISTAISSSKLIPLNAVVKEVTMKVLTTFTSSGAASLTIGNSVSSTGYFQARPLSEFVDNAVFYGNGPLIWDDTNDITKLFLVDDTVDRNIGIKVSAGTPITAGKARIAVKYYMFGDD